MRSSSLSSVPSALATITSRPPGRSRGANARSIVGRREVAGLGDGVDLVGGVGVGAHPRGGVREDDVDLAELGGQRGDGGAVAHVEHPALDLGDRRSSADGGRRGLDAARIAAGEQHAVLGAHAGGEPVDEGAAEALVGAGDKCDA